MQRRGLQTSLGRLLMGDMRRINTAAGRTYAVHKRVFELSRAVLIPNSSRKNNHNKSIRLHTCTNKSRSKRSKRSVSFLRLSTHAATAGNNIRQTHQRRRYSRRQFAWKAKHFFRFHEITSSQSYFGVNLGAGICTIMLKMPFAR